MVFYFQMSETAKRDADKIRSSDTRILRLTEEVTRLRQITRKRNLPQREVMEKKIGELTNVLDKKEHTIQVRLI